MNTHQRYSHYIIWFLIATYVILLCYFGPRYPFLFEVPEQQEAAPLLASLPNLISVFLALALVSFGWQADSIACGLIQYYISGEHIQHLCSLHDWSKGLGESQQALSDQIKQHSQGRFSSTIRRTTRIKNEISGIAVIVVLLGAAHLTPNFSPALKQIDIAWAFPSIPPRHLPSWAFFIIYPLPLFLFSLLFSHLKHTVDSIVYKSLSTLRDEKTKEEKEKAEKELKALQEQSKRYICMYSAPCPNNYQETLYCTSHAPCELGRKKIVH